MTIMRFDAQARAAVLRTIAAILLIGEVHDTNRVHDILWLRKQLLKSLSTDCVHGRLNLKRRLATAMQTPWWHRFRTRQ